jgi:hypothetical protein
MRIIGESNFSRSGGSASFEIEGENHKDTDEDFSFREFRQGLSAEQPYIEWSNVRIANQRLRMPDL